MRKITQIGVLMFLLLLISQTVEAQATKITVVIGIKDSNCGKGSEDIGYQVMYGGDNSHYDLETQGKAKLKNSSSYRNMTTTNAVSNRSKGDYLYIISAKVTHPGCSNSVYGVGYGDNATQAKNDAIKNLQTRNWSWSNTKHGYSVELSKQL